MRSAGISELAIFGGLVGSAEAFSSHVQAEHVALFSRHFPDQGDCIAEAAAELRCTTYSELRQRLQYKGPPELLSMYMCFLRGATINDPRRAREVARAHQVSHGSLPSPRRLAELVRVA